MTPEPSGTETAVSLVRDDVLFRLQKAAGLIPATGDGRVRRMLFFVLLAWLPLFLWAVMARRAWPGEMPEPFLAHFGIHVRFLVALPALILGEAVAHRVTTQLVPQFVRSGIVPETEARFQQVVRGVLRLRDSVAPWLLIGVVIAGWLAIPREVWPMHELVWTESSAGAGAARGFGGWWYFFVARPIFQVFLFAWLWRVVLLTVLLWRIARLDLRLAPLHPDRLGGLGFIQGFPGIFAPFALACSSLLAAHWAHEVVYHGQHLAAFKLHGIVFALATLLLLLAPLAAFTPALGRMRRRALLEYGSLASRHSWLVHRRWILQENVNDAVLSAPELGPVADVQLLYQAVRRIRSIPIGKQALLSIAVPLVVPFIAVCAIEVPIGELIGKVLKAVL